jgi:hypothetical protein
MRRLTACAAAALCLALGVALPRPARAQGQPAGVTVVHRETVRVGPRPGPPVVLGWLSVLLASGGLLAAILFAWWQVRPVRRSETWSWT